MDFSKINKVHVIGIGGIGVSAVAKIFLEQGKAVTGSDVSSSELTQNLEKRGVKIYYNHEASNLAEDVDLLVYSPAVPENNPERQKAAELNIQQKSYPEFLGVYSHDKKTIAVSGTNGKSTTTAMLGKIFIAAGLDPTIIVGTQVAGFDGNFRHGNSDILIVEACEWKGHMLNLLPQTIVLTNLEPDHLDFYKNLDELKHYFQKYINNLPVAEGKLIYNADDTSLKSLIKNKGYAVKSWSVNFEDGDYRATDIAFKKQKIDFKVNGHLLSLKVPGTFNIYNALAAAACAREFKIDWKIIKQSLAEFSGSWRRFEKIGPVKGKKNTLVISDYAHHPTALKGTLKAAKDFYPDKRLVVAFQPHHFDRTAKLFDDFAKSFAWADVLVICQVYDVAGREADGQRTIGSQQLVNAIQKLNPLKEIYYAPDLEQTEKMLREKIQPNDLILIVGAGDIDNIARNLV
ncbi:MAG: UDP-N-acetylmuramate--L-alanine ligase [Candidatus Komeilibacteria bacterium]|nr:UDP-N-acetylmuramate--L-alanine ligase [Candidatus Komeilibacteria bacterium]